MSDLKVDGFKASDILTELDLAFNQIGEAEKKKQIKKANGIFELRIKNDKGTEAVWTIDMKKDGKVYKGPAKPKADCTISFSDDTFTLLYDGKTDAQKAFMTGKLKVKGNMMIATKLDVILKTAKVKAKL